VPSWTISSPNLRRLGPVIEVQVGMTSAEETAARAVGDPVPAPLTVAALIDTGASHTVLQQNLAAQLGLKPVSSSAFRTASSASAVYHQYTIRLFFPHGVEIEVLAVEMPLQGQHIQCLLGRDVLADGVLVYLGQSNMFSLSF
jgi:predicted aspartyl protease